MGVSLLAQPERSASKALASIANPVRFHASAVRSACKPGSGGRRDPVSRITP